MTPRRAGVLAGHLPAGAQTWISCGYDAAWTQAEHLAALQFDAAQIANWQRSGGSSKMPDPMRRPSDDRDDASSSDRMAERIRLAQERQRASTPTPKPRARDAKGRFVKEA